MSDVTKTWDGALVGKWLDARIAAARLDQAAADRRGYDARDDYDKAAAEEWVCRALNTGAGSADRAAFAEQIKALLGQDDYAATGIHDDLRFDRHIRGTLRKIAKMTRANGGFDNMLRYQP